MIDKLEDYLMDYKSYSTKFKEDIRYLRYLVWSIAAAGADIQHYYAKDAFKDVETLAYKLDIWTSKELEVEE